MIFTGPGSVFAALVKQARRDFGYLTRDEAHIAVSQDVYDAYREVIVHRCGGPEEMRRQRKKAKQKAKKAGVKYVDSGLRYATYPLVVDDSLPTGTYEWRVNDSVREAAQA